MEKTIILFFLGSSIFLIGYFLGKYRERKNNKAFIIHGSAGSGKMFYKKPKSN